MGNETFVEELNVIDLIKFCLKRIKLLLIVLLCSIVAGGALGAVTSIGERYYGTQIQFYINPKEEKQTDSESISNYGVYGSYGNNVMETMVHLLESDLFTEQLIEGWNRVPEKYNEDGSISQRYKECVYFVKECVSFSYSQNPSEADVTTSNLAKSFIFIDISVKGDENKEIAGELLELLRDKVPVYIVAHMIVPKDYDGTNCEEISTISEIQRLNEGEMAISAIKFALLFAVVGAVVVCTVVIVIERNKLVKAAKEKATEEKTE